VVIDSYKSISIGVHADSEKNWILGNIDKKDRMMMKHQTAQLPTLLEL